MPEMSIADAAKWAGKGKPAILKAIQRGDLTARKDEGGQWRIDPAELGRVYPPGTAGTASQTAQEPPARTAETDLLRELVEASRREANEARQDRDAWKAEAAKWQEEAAAVRLLAAPAKAQEPPQEAAEQPPAVIQAPAAPPAPQGLRAKLAGWIGGSRG